LTVFTATVIFSVGTTVSSAALAIPGTKAADAATAAATAAHFTPVSLEVMGDPSWAIELKHIDRH
jgi:hypothetical protein